MPGNSGKSQEIHPDAYPETRWTFIDGDKGAKCENARIKSVIISEVHALYVVGEAPLPRQFLENACISPVNLRIWRFSQRKTTPICYLPALNDCTVDQIYIDKIPVHCVSVVGFVPL